MSTPVSGTDSATSVDTGSAVQIVSDGDTASEGEATALQVLADTLSETAVAADSAVAGYVDVVVWLVSPNSGDTVYTGTPTFTFAIKRVSFDASLAPVVDLQVSTTADFSSGVLSATIFTAPTSGRAVATTTTIRSATVLTPGAYYWRVRSEIGVGGWTVAAQFVVASSTTSATSVLGRWNCGSTTPQPAVWFAVPPRARSGAAATVVGSGLGAGGGASVVMVGSGVATTAAWHTIAATPDAYTSIRIIDPTGPVVSPEHSEVTFTVPEVGDPGGKLVVTVDSTPPPPPFALPLLWWVGDDYAGSNSWPGRGALIANLFVSSPPIPAAPALNGHQGLDLTSSGGLTSVAIDLSAGLHLFAVIRPMGGASGDPTNPSLNRLFYADEASTSTTLTLFLSTDGSNLTTLSTVVTDSAFSDTESVTLATSVQNTPLVVEWMYAPTALRAGGANQSVTPDPGNTGTPAGVAFTSAQTGMRAAATAIYEMLVYSTLSSADLAAVRSYLATTYGVTV